MFRSTRTVWVAVGLGAAVLLVGVLGWPGAREGVPPVHAQLANPPGYFLKIGAVPGTATQMGHEKEIAVLSWSWGVNAPAGAGAGRLARVTPGPLVITKECDVSSVSLWQAAATGKHFESAVLSCTRAPLDDFLVITLSDVAVADCSVSGEAGGPVHEQLSLSYRKIEWEYRPMSGRGPSAPVKGSWSAGA